MNSSGSLIPYLVRFRWRLRLRDGLLYSQNSLWIASVMTAFFLMVVRIFPIEQRGWVWTPLAVWFLGNIGYALLKPRSPMTVAQQIDNELDLKERLSSSLALSENESSPLYTSFEPMLVEKAHWDAMRFAREINPTHDFPLYINRKPLLIAGVILIASFFLVFLPNPMDEVIKERKEIAAEARRQAAEIEKIQEDIGKAEQLSQEERDMLMRKLAELAEQLRSSQGDREQALADLSRLEQELKQQLDPKGSQRQAALDAMSAQIQSLANNSNPQIGDLEAAADALEQLAEQLQMMSEEERQALADQLAQMAARAAQAGDGNLAQALASLAQAAQSKNFESAQESAQQAADALRQARSELAKQSALNQALSQIQNSRQRISQAGQRSQLNQGQPNQSGQNQGQGQTQSQGQGQGQGQSSGGGGTNADTLPPATNMGQASEPQGQGQNSGVSNLESQIYVPREKLESITGEEMFITGQDTDQGETQTSEQPDPLGGVNNPGLVPYSAVYKEYMNAANQAIDQAYIPPELKDYIREYFTYLEP